MQLAHEGYQDIVKTKQLLREKVWYPAMDSDVKQTISNYIPCQAVGPATRSEPLHDTHEDNDYDDDDTLTTQPLRNRRLVRQR